MGETLQGLDVRLQVRFHYLCLVHVNCLPSLSSPRPVPPTLPLVFNWRRYGRERIWLSWQVAQFSLVSPLVVVQSLSLQTVARRASLFITNSQSLLKVMSIEFGDDIQPSHHLSSPFPPALDLSQHQGRFQWVGSSHQVAKVLEFQLQHQSFQWIFRTDFL